MWTITKPEPGDSTLITDDDRVVGSIARIKSSLRGVVTRPVRGAIGPDLYRIEVLWSGPSGDIIHETPLGLVGHFCFP
jgi:hypothetical protein